MFQAYAELAEMIFHSFNGSGTAKNLYTILKVQVTKGTNIVLDDFLIHLKKLKKKKKNQWQYLKRIIIFISGTLGDHKSNLKKMYPDWKIKKEGDFDFCKMGTI